ncbi:hypothetical protein [Actinokineospora globicatena]|uniref:Uncharacterized protein n=1 Tax=Actinokineospora globicatena TaxID=103729 RepID=A0A9W6QJ68_9PSEU|nr:hypothetical protein [Actinokineospora globicatena]GLW89579.1 hypothetical protein Aglo03_03950 [Actinokineospora globicatena]
MTEDELVGLMSVTVDISRELEDDHVEFWKLAKGLSRALPAADKDTIKTCARAMLIALLDSNVVLGDLSGHTGLFEPWPDPLLSIDAAMASWQELDREPNMGDIGWLSRLPGAENEQ